MHQVIKYNNKEIRINQHHPSKRLTKEAKINTGNTNKVLLPIKQGPHRMMNVTTKIPRMTYQIMNTFLPQIIVEDR